MVSRGHWGTKREGTRDPDARAPSAWASNKNEAAGTDEAVFPRLRYQNLAVLLLDDRRFDPEPLFGSTRLTESPERWPWIEGVGQFTLQRGRVALASVPGGVLGKVAAHLGRAQE